MLPRKTLKKIIGFCEARVCAYFHYRVREKRDMNSKNENVKSHITSLYKSEPSLWIVSGDDKQENGVTYLRLHNILKTLFSTFESINFLHSSQTCNVANPIVLYDRNSSDYIKNEIRTYEIVTINILNFTKNNIFYSYCRFNMRIFHYED